MFFEFIKIYQPVGKLITRIPVDTLEAGPTPTLTASTPASIIMEIKCILQNLPCRSLGMFI